MGGQFQREKNGLIDGKNTKKYVGEKLFNEILKKEKDIDNDIKGDQYYGYKIEEKTYCLGEEDYYIACKLYETEEMLSAFCNSIIIPISKKKQPQINVKTTTRLV